MASENQVYHPEIERCFTNFLRPFILIYQHKTRMVHIEGGTNQNENQQTYFFFKKRKRKGSKHIALFINLFLFRNLIAAIFY